MEEETSDNQRGPDNGEGNCESSDGERSSGLTQGGTVKVKKNFKLKKTQYENGKKISEEEYLEAVEEEEYIEPDFKAISFWLRNKAPEDWRDKILENQDNDGPQENLIILTPRQVNQMKEAVSGTENEKN